MPRRGENIFRRKDGRWEARYVREITVDGKKKYGSVYAATYREVKQKQLMHITDPKLSARKNKEKTVGTIMEEWLFENKNRLKESTLQKYRIIIKNHISLIGDLPLNLVTSEAIAQFTDILISQSHLSNETVNEILIVLGMGFRFAKVSCNAVLPDIHLLKSKRQSIRVLSAAEQKTLVEQLFEINDVFSFGVLLALFTGMRIGEVCALKWENVSAETIRICATMQRLNTGAGKTEIVIIPPKTASSEREIPIPGVLLQEIAKRRRSSGIVLLQDNGNFVEPRLLQHKFTKIAKNCGLCGVHFHTLRHTFATRCIEAGVDVKTLSEILGHSNVKTTLNCYVHSSLELKKRSMDKLASGV